MRDDQEKKTQRLRLLHIAVGYLRKFTVLYKMFKRNDNPHDLSYPIPEIENYEEDSDRMPLVPEQDYQGLSDYDGSDLGSEAFEEFDGSELVKRMREALVSLKEDDSNPALTVYNKVFNLPMDKPLLDELAKEAEQNPKAKKVFDEFYSLLETEEV